MVNYIYHTTHNNEYILNEVLSMVDIGRSVSDITRGLERKVKYGPPEVPDVVDKALSIPADVEHDLPLPPLVENVHKDITKSVLYKMPRLFNHSGIINKIRF